MIEKTKGNDLTSNEDPFEDFVRQLAPEHSTSEEAYSRVRGKLIKFFEWRRCNDSGALADETIARVVKSLYSGQEVLKPSAYVFGIAQRVFWEFVSSRVVELGVPEASDASLDCKRLCIEKLAKDDRELIIAYYSGGPNILAESLGITVANLRLRVYRIRKKLADCNRLCKEERKNHSSSAGSG